MGYHKTEIPKGVVGQLSKVEEELLELKDATEQECKILQLVELSDLYGAIEEYTYQKFNMSMDDLKQMSDLTKSAFKEGKR